MRIVGRFTSRDRERKANKKILKAGSVMKIATTDVITIPPTSTIMGSLKTMVSYGFRRVPIADPGTKRLEGIITGTDIINFFGGGDKHQIVEERYDNNLLAAVNEEIREIMEREVITIDFTSSWEDALETLLEKGVGGSPILDRENRVVGIVTERDMLEFLAAQRRFDGYAKDYMTRGVVTIQPETTIEDAMRMIILKRMRRLPVIKDGVLVGLVTSSTLLNYLRGEAFRILTTGDVNEVLQKPLKVMLSNESMQYRRPLTFSLNVRISEVAKKMIERNYGAALILDGGKLEGIITERDLIKFLCTVKR
jgi:CBS domain-containing protein